MIEKTIDLLGLRSKDRVTGFRGTITSVSFDLYGCVQVAVTPDIKEGDTELKHGHWFDVHRLEVFGKERVMPVPNFRDLTTIPNEPSTFEHGPDHKAPPKI